MTTAAPASQRTVVVLGGRGRHEFDILRELGCRIVYLDFEVPLDLMPVVDVPVDADLGDVAAVEKAVRRLAGTSPDAVLTHVEPRLPLMAELRDRLGLPANGLSLDAARTCRDKWLTRRRLALAGVPSPAALLAHSAAEAEVVAARIGLPVVVKPRDGAGGLGVRLCRTTAEVRSAAEAVLSLLGRLVSTAGVLVEEYADGPEYAVQTRTDGGRTTVASVFAQSSTPPPVFVELGYEHPCGLPADELRELESLVGRALAAVGIVDWISHTQVRRTETGFQIIEINARRPGGRLVEMTTVVSGLDLVRAATEIALGLPVTETAPTATHAAYRSIVFDRPGTVRYRTSIDVPHGPAVPPPVVELDVAPGAGVLPVDDPAGGVYGRVLAFGGTADEATGTVAAVFEALDLRVGPVADTNAETIDVREFKPCC